MIDTIHNIIFLDIDGVMNSELLWISRHKYDWAKPWAQWWKIKSYIRWIVTGSRYKTWSLLNYQTPKNFWSFKRRFKDLQNQSCPKKWKMLVKLCEDTNSRICISSTWRRNFKKVSDWQKALIELGFNENSFAGITGERRSCRGEEIQEWLDKNLIINNYVIIDDDSDMLPEQKEHFFQTNPYVGLTHNTCYRIKCFLNNV